MSKLLHIEEPTPPQRGTGWSLQDFLKLGFRPLYLGGALWAIVAVGMWVFAPQWLLGPLSGVFWHAHEMLWGFIAAIAVGFLLTATNNWTGINPLHGPALGGVTLLWLLARLCFLMPSPIAYGIACAADLAFLGLVCMAITRTLWRSKSRNNYGLPLLLLGMGLANAAFVWAIWRGANYTQLMHHLFTGMLCMLTIALLLARRVIPFFASRAIAGLNLERHTRSGQWQIGCAVVAIAGWHWQLPVLSAVFFTAAGVIALWHLLAWKPWAVLRVPLLWILYLGYASMACGLFAAASYVMGWTLRLSWPVHVMAVAGFAPLILGMITRTALGHTGRMLHADKAMVCSFYLLVISLALRLLALHSNTSSVAWLHASALCWGLALLIYLLRFTPILVRPRIDKRPGKPIVLRRT